MDLERNAARISGEFTNKGMSALSSVVLVQLVAFWGVQRCARK
jgi:hypothetical protein